MRYFFCIWKIWKWKLELSSHAVLTVRACVILPGYKSLQSLTHFFHDSYIALRIINHQLQCRVRYWRLLFRTTACSWSCVTFSERVLQKPLHTLFSRGNVRNQLTHTRWLGHMVITWVSFKRFERMQRYSLNILETFAVLLTPPRVLETEIFANIYCCFS